MKSVFIKSGLALALVGAFALAAFAQTPAQTQQPTERMEKRGGFGRHGRGDAGGRKFERHAFRQLNLTDTQREQLRAIHERNRQNFQPQREELRQLAQVRRNGGTLTTEQLARMQALHDQLRAHGEKLHAEMQSVLTAEQQEQLKQQREQFKQRRDEFKQRRQERRNGRFGAQPSATPNNN